MLKLNMLLKAYWYLLLAIVKDKCFLLEAWSVVKTIGSVGGTRTPDLSIMSAAL